MTEPHCLVEQPLPPRIDPSRIRPSGAKGGIDRLEHRIETFRQVGAIGLAEWNAGVVDPPFGANQALAHRLGRGQKGRGDGGGIEPEDGLQYQWTAHRRIDGRMGASEHQTQTPVGYIRRVHRCRCLLDRQQQPVGGLLTGAPPPRHVDHPSACRGQEPSVGCLRDTASRPAGKCRCKSIGERILGGRDIAGTRGEVGYQLAVALPCRALGCTMRGCRVGHITQIGRTSTVP